MKIKTEQLKELMAKAIKGASNHKLLPITGFVMIKNEKKKFTLTTTDGVNILEVSADNAEGKDLYAVVVAELFNKLIARTSTEYVNLEVTKKGLEVKGNGVYIFDMPLDEEGKVVSISIPEIISKESKQVDLEDIKGVLYSNKSAIAETFEVPCLTGYYSDSTGVITSDGLKICNTNNKIFNESALISTELMDLLSVFDTDDILLSVQDNLVLFSSKRINVYGKLMSEVEDYPVKDIKEYFTIKFENEVKLNKNKVLEVLDRLSIFTEGYDKSVLQFNFEDSELVILDKDNTICEKIKYESLEGKAGNFACNVDITLLTPQIKALDSEVFTIHYGLENAIMMTTPNIKQIISLAGEE